jgi:hypothetical protein
MKTDSLQQFVTLRRQLTQERDQLQNRLRSINEALGELQGITASPAAANAGTETNGAPSTGRGGKRTMSPEARARIAAAQKARWAAQKGGKSAAASNNGSGDESKPKRKMSAAGRKAIAEAARRRWAAARAAGKSSL